MRPLFLGWGSLWRGGGEEGVIRDAKRSLYLLIQMLGPNLATGVPKERYPANNLLNLDVHSTMPTWGQRLGPET